MLNDEAKEVLIGSMLGDGSMRRTGKNASFIISRALKDLKYLEYEFSIFREFCKTGIVKKRVFDKRTQKFYYKCYFHTLTNPIFNKYYEEWYPKGQKTIPKNLNLTPLICAIWFCDDGSITMQSSTSLVLKLSTNGFTQKEVNFLASLLTRELHENFFVSKNEKGHFIINAGTNATLKFANYIKNVMPNSMERKKVWNNLQNVNPRKSNLLLKLERECALFSLLSDGTGKTRLDIAKHVDLLCFNKNKKCFYLRQDFATLLEQLVHNDVLKKENTLNTNYYYIKDRQYFLTKQKELGKFNV